MLCQISWTELHVWQRVNHFPEAKQLTRKDNLKRHIQRFSNIPGKLGDFFDILPVSVRVLHATSRMPRRTVANTMARANHAQSSRTHSFM